MFDFSTANTSLLFQVYSPLPHLQMLPQSQTGFTAAGMLYVDYLLLAKFSLGEGLNR